MTPGCLVLVVGPSGAGKDTLIGAARSHFVGSPRFIFPRRVVTRKADSASEDHYSMSMEDFVALEREGCFALSWHAHGLAYGIPASVIADLAAGRTVVVNVSRRIIPSAYARFSPVTVIEVTAPPAVLLARLAARQRSADGSLEDRVNRKVEPYPDGLNLVSIVNDGPREQAIATFIQALERLTSEITAPVSHRP